MPARNAVSLSIKQFGGAGSVVVPFGHSQVNQSVSAVEPPPKQSLCTCSACTCSAARPAIGSSGLQPYAVLPAPTRQAFSIYGRVVDAAVPRLGFGFLAFDQPATATALLRGDRSASSVPDGPVQSRRLYVPSFGVTVELKPFSQQQAWP